MGYAVFEVTLETQPQESVEGPVPDRMSHVDFFERDEQTAQVP